MTQPTVKVGEVQSILKETSPVVSVDIRLGQQYSDVSFDYDAFEKEADRRDLTPEQQSELSISLTPRNFYSLNGGAHYPTKSHIDVGVRRVKKVNSTLRHELQHVADYRAKNPKHCGSNVRYGFHRLVKTPSMLLMGYESIKGQVDVIQAYVNAKGATAPYIEKVTEDLTALTSTRIALLSSMAVYLWSYQFHPRERRARSAGREEGEKIISLQEKP